VLVGSEFWNGMLDWIKKVLLNENGNISESDLDLFHIVDRAEEFVEIINNFYNKH
jgi:predicted Rossmann-fold nucleotide-binding protein